MKKKTEHTAGQKHKKLAKLKHYRELVRSDVRAERKDQIEYSKPINKPSNMSPSNLFNWMNLVK